jgi:hypothetical protein
MHRSADQGEEHTMPINPRPISSKPIGVYTTALLLSGALIGCSGSKVAGPRTEHPERIAINDFVDPDLAQAEDQSSYRRPTHESSPPVEQDPAGLEQSQPIRPDDGFTLTSSDFQSNFQTDAQTDAQGASPLDETIQASTSTERLALLEAKVGDVNGKPIFTNSFFAPIEDRLIAESQRLSPANWRRAAGGIIANRLDGIIADELLRAEALASLTPTQRVGLQAFLNNFRNNMLSENLGSSQLANRRVLEEEGVTLDEALRQKEVDTLVQLTLIQEVNRRVNVSWRDIKQRYERDIKEFSPPPTAVFRVIRAFKDKEDTVNEIQTQLDSGVDFLKVSASPLNNYNTDAAGMLTIVVEDTFADTEFFGAEELNTPAQQLQIGESVGPIELGSMLYWIKLMDIERVSISLYDAQLQIQRDLTFERRKDAQQEYLGRLMERARVSSREEVLIRLLQIADERYGRQG